LLLSGRNLILPIGTGISGAAEAAIRAVPTQLTLDATDTGIAGTSLTIPQLHGSIAVSAAGASITSLNAALPASSTLWLSGTLDPAGRLQAKTVFASRQLGGLFSAYGADPALPATWQEASLAADIAGTADDLAFSNLEGIIGPSRIAGTVLLRQREVLGSLHFDQLDLTPFAALLRNPPGGLPGQAPRADFELSADRASLGTIPLTHLLIDAALGNQLLIRRLTASLSGGIAAGSFTLSPTPGQAKPPTGFIGSAKAILALPSAQPLAALAPAFAQPPAAITKAPLAISFLAAGPADALATSAMATLGPISITAAPRIDLLNQTAEGAFTLRHPSAIAAFKAFGLPAGLAWPGAGSIALRANLLLSPTQIGFSDFDLSMGDLTGNGRLIYTAGRQLNGEIDADTLALPPIPASFTPNWPELFQVQGNIALFANRVLWGGNQILGPVTANLTSNANRLDLAIGQASLAGGVLKGDFSATGNTALAVTAKFAVSGSDASQLHLPFKFPLTLPTGTIDAAGALTAGGYAPAAWLATLSGSASLAAHDGTINGFDLAAAAAALTAKKRRLALLRNACIAGATSFTQLGLTGAFNSGIYSLATATLQSPSGSAAAAGSIDLPDTGLNLKLTLLPQRLAVTIAGNWTSPRKAVKISK
jgi:hypothetical protein